MGDENGNLHIPESLNMPHFINSLLMNLLLSPRIFLYSLFGRWIALLNKISSFLFNGNEISHLVVKSITTLTTIFFCCRHNWLEIS